MLGSRARQRERKQPDAYAHTRAHIHIHFDPQRIQQMIDNPNHTAASNTATTTTNTSSPTLKPTATVFESDGQPPQNCMSRTAHSTELISDDSKVEPATATASAASLPQLKHSSFSSTYLRRILASLYTPASYLATAIHNSAPAPPFDPTEPPLSPRSAALASAVAYPFTAAPAVYSVPFIINDQICVVPYVPLPRPAGYTSRPSTPLSSSAATQTFSPLSPTRSSPPHSPLSPPSPPSPALYELLPEQSLQLGEQWLSVLSPASLSAHFHPNLYAKLLHTPTPYQSHITKDITRTFPTHPLFQQHKTRSMLYNVLAAYSNYDHDIGYSQGMAFLVGFLLLHNLADECQLYWAFVSLMYCERWSLRSLYFDDCVSLKRLLLLTQRCLDERPELSALSTQLHGLSLEVTLFATQWYVTVYSYRFDAAFSERVWSLFMDGGWRVLLCVALAVMEWLQARVAGLSFEGVMGEVRGMEAVGVEVAERSTALRLSAEVEKELEACKRSEKRVRALKV